MPQPSCETCVHSYPYSCIYSFNVYGCPNYYGLIKATDPFNFIRDHADPSRRSQSEKHDE